MFLYLLKSDMELSSVNAFSALLANRIGTIDYFSNKLFNAFTSGYVWLRAYLNSLCTQETEEAEHESQGLLVGAD